MSSANSPAPDPGQPVPYGKTLAAIAILGIITASILTLIWYDTTSVIFGGLSFVLAVAGIIVSVAGFAYTLAQISRTRRATAAVNEAVSSLKVKIKLVDVSTEASRVIKLLETSIVHLRHRSWSNASFSLWDAQTSLYKLKNGLGLSQENLEVINKSTESFLLSIQTLDDLGMKNIADFDYSALVYSIRIVVNIVDDAIADRQKDLYDA